MSFHSFQHSAHLSCKYIVMWIKSLMKGKGWVCIFLAGKNPNKKKSKIFKNYEKKLISWTFRTRSLIFDNDPDQHDSTVTIIDSLYFQNWTSFTLKKHGMMQTKKCIKNWYNFPAMRKPNTSHIVFVLVLPVLFTA